MLTTKKVGLKKKIYMVLTKKFTQIYNFMKLVVSYINGDFAYQQFLQHHSGCCVPSKKQFLAAKRKQKWQNCNRCC